MNACHRKACQQRTDAIMHSGVYFKKLQVRVEAPKKSILGRKMNFHFCPNCGGFVCWNADIRPDQYGMAVGAFADPNFPPPTYSVWEESKHAWVHLPDGIQQFQQGRI